jgi:hypothetical protein
MASAATERPARRTPFQRHDPVKRHIGGTRLRTHGGAPSPCQHVSRPPRLLSSLSSRCRMSAGSPAFEPLPEPVVVTCLGGPSRANVPYASHPPLRPPRGRASSGHRQPRTNIPAARHRAARHPGASQAAACHQPLPPFEAPKSFTHVLDHRRLLLADPLVRDAPSPTLCQHLSHEVYREQRPP